MPLEWCYACNGLNSSKVVTTGTLILGKLTIVLLVLYSALYVFLLRQHSCSLNLLRESR
ncbi:hypothetical protein Hanom_Chr17g01556441 [Helianthus anomalus]